MPFERIAPAGLIAVGSQVMSLANTTAVALTSTLRTAKASHLLISVETVGVRLRADSTAPTNNTGVLLTSTNSPYTFDAYDGSANFKLNRNGGSGTAKATIQAFKHVGEGR